MRAGHLVLRLEPLPMVRKVDVHVEQGLFDRLLDEEIRRRMLVRIGSYLPSDAHRRQCALIEEQTRIEEYLHDEGYFEAVVSIVSELDANRANVEVTVDLGAEYALPAEEPKILLPGGFVAVTPPEVRALFHHKRFCILLCFGSTQFTRTQHQEDLLQVKDLLHKRGYPAARITSNFDPKTSFDRRNKKVQLTITIDPRRRLDIHFEGVDTDTVDDEGWRQHLTFDDAGSTDDVEAANSARSLQDYLQTHGRFDARVTWSRERLDEYDRVTFHVFQGPTRTVQQVQFACNDGPCPKGRQPLDEETLSGIVATKLESFTGDLLGTNVSATSRELAADVDRIREAYRRAGYREATITVSANPLTMPEPSVAPPSAAVTAALVESGGDGLNVRFAIDEGHPTLLTRVEIEAQDESARQALAGGMCDQLLRELANELAIKDVARQPVPSRCAANVRSLPYREDNVELTKDRLRDFLFKQARPRAQIALEARVVGPYSVEAHFQLASVDERRVGKIVVRGDFHTRRSVISGLLDLPEGVRLTSDAIADAARRLRNTGLFEAVNVDFVDLDSGASEVNAVVRVEERYDHRAEVDLQGGYSSYNSWFATVGLGFNNLYGYGIALTSSFTYGEKIRDFESKLIFPKWFTGLGGQISLTGQYLRQDTPRFGLLTTEAGTLGYTWLDPHPRATNRDAYTQSIGIHYDYRLRTRNIDALRPIGVDGDDTQVAVSTTTGSIGITAERDQRDDRNGQLAPLAPEQGYHLFAQAAWAFPELVTLVGGQYSFIKLSASASYFHLFGKNLIVRADLRYDEGFPLGGAALLPEVERFFAGGDNTVRGFDDDRLATQIVQVGVPPLSNLSQIRVIPAGGDIRMMSSLDAQYHIYWIMAGAAFVDTGMIANQWSLVTLHDVRPSTGMGLRFLSPFGIAAIEYAVPLTPHLGDDPRGRYHLYFAARATF
jgi:outer membrane protein assembly factor BamA